MMGRLSLWRIARSLGMLTYIAISASLCADQEVILDGQVSNCSRLGETLSKKGLEGACTSFFCATCAHANACDASCGFCQPVKGTTERSLEDENHARPDIDNPCSDNNVLLNGFLVDCATAAFAVSAHGLEGACPAFFCASCPHAHTCDKSCGWCGEIVNAKASLSEEELEGSKIVASTKVDEWTVADDEAVESFTATNSSSNQNFKPVANGLSLPYWWPCSSGELLDCQGRCRSPSACYVAPLAYTTCRHWISDGSCDDGCYSVRSQNRNGASANSGLRSSSSTRMLEVNLASEKSVNSNTESVAHCGRRSDEGESMAWNCPLYGCDGGDCEVCQANPPGVPPHAMAPRHLLTSSATSAELADSHSGPKKQGDDLSWLWPGPDNDHAVAYRAQCRNLPLHVAGETTILTCAEAIEQRLATCEQTFCDRCGVLAGVCDVACNYCQRGINPFQRSWPGRSKPWFRFDAVHPLAWPSDFTRSELPDQEKTIIKKQPIAACAVAIDAGAVLIHSIAKSDLAAAIQNTQAELGRNSNDSTTDSSNASNDERNSSVKDENFRLHSRNIEDNSTSKSHVIAPSPSGKTRQPVSWVIVLTVCLSPLPGITYTVRTLPQLRLRDYARALRRWAGDPNLPVDSINGPSPPLASHKRSGNESEPSTPWPLVVVESSGANLTALRWAVAEGYAAAQAYHDGNDNENSKSHDLAGHGGMPTIGSSSPTWRSRQHERRRARRMGQVKLRPIEFVSLQLTRASAGEVRNSQGVGSNNLTKLPRGKGVAEAASIVAALEKSEIVRKLKPAHAVKVTGRYFVRNLDSELHRITREAAAEHSKTGTPPTPSNLDGVPIGPSGHSDIAADVPTANLTMDKGSSGNNTLIKAAETLWPQDSASAQQPWPLLTLQSTPAAWSVWDGIIRSEVVGFALWNDKRSNHVPRQALHERNDKKNRRSNSSHSSKPGHASRADDNRSEASVAQGAGRWAEALFANQNEVDNRPMERVLFENARALWESSSTSGAFKENLQVERKPRNGAVQWFNSLEIDSTPDAQNTVIEML